ncbi:hypothetical protein [Streptomyces bacillaris]|uniref:hypothetical protein n=1 Tax=Streptomyces bacillaris TaxID=68179 RepID=UPI00345FD29C
MPDVQGRCPACGAASLFLGEGGHVTCARIDCPNPSAADDMLHGGEEALVHALGGGRTANVIAHNLTAHGHSLADVRRMTDDELRAVPGIGDTSLATIRRAFQERPAGSDVRQQPPVVATARVALNVAVTASDYALAKLQRHAARVTQKTDATVTVAPYGEGYQVTITRAGGTTRHGGYGFDAVQGMLLGVMAASQSRHLAEHPLVAQVTAAVRSVLRQDLPGDTGEHVTNAVMDAVRPAEGARQATVPVPPGAFDRLVRVAMWVSRGRSMAHTPDPQISSSYPDTAARYALGALDDAGLLNTYRQAAAEEAPDA